MIRLIGEVDCTVDNKSRLKIPSSILKQYGETPVEFIIQMGIDACLYLFRRAEWEEYQSKIDELDEFDPEQMLLYRRLQHGTTILSIDSSERILLPKRLMEQVGIDKEVCLYCRKSCIEIWDLKTFQDMMSQPLDVKLESAKYLSKPKISGNIN
jgi:MraZ protein